MDAAIFINEPLYFKGNISVYPPTVRDVIANPRYGAYSALLTVSQEDLWDKLVDWDDVAEMRAKIPTTAPTPFEYLFSQCTTQEGLDLVEDAIAFFCHEPVRVISSGKMILFTDGFDKVKDLAQVRYIDEESYFEFQNYIRRASGDNECEPSDPNENPRVARIKAKGRKRDRIKKKKGNSSSITTSQMLVAACCMNLGLTPLNIGEIAFPSLTALFNASLGKEKSRVDVQLIAGGADSKKIKPKDWIKEIK